MHRPQIFIIIVISPQLSTGEHRPPLERVLYSSRIHRRFCECHRTSSIVYSHLQLLNSLCEFGRFSMIFKWSIVNVINWITPKRNWTIFIGFVLRNQFMNCSTYSWSARTMFWVPISWTNSTFNRVKRWTYLVPIRCKRHSAFQFMLLNQFIFCICIWNILYMNVSTINHWFLNRYRGLTLTRLPSY